MPAVTGFHQDDDGHWVAELACGHTQHVRHRPPWETRAWVTSEEGRAGHLGLDLACPFCRMPQRPAGLQEFQRTPEFTPETTPAGLRKSHRVALGVWAEIVVAEGRVVYVIEDEAGLVFVLRPGVTGMVAPQRPHHVEPESGSRFFVRFLR
jgi:tellurite methyltransferase